MGCVTRLPTSGLYYKESGHPDYVTSVPKCAVQMKLRPGREVQPERENRVELYKDCLKFLKTRVELDLALFKDDIWSH